MRKTQKSLKMSIKEELKITPSQEMYLKAIILLENEKNTVLAKDIAEVLKVTKPSVTGALQQLTEKGLVKYEKYSSITLTELGQKKAREILKLYDLLCLFLENILQIKKADAEFAACDMEHIIPPLVRERLIKYKEHSQQCQRGSRFGMNPVRALNVTCVSKKRSF